MSVDALLRRVTKHSPAETETEHLILELGVALDELSIENDRLKRELLEASQNNIAYGAELSRYADTLHRIARLQPDTDESAQDIALETLGLQS